MFTTGGAHLPRTHAQLQHTAQSCAVNDYMGAEGCALLDVAPGVRSQPTLSLEFLALP